MEEPTTPKKVMFSDEEIYNELKDLPEFKHLPLPRNWYAKFNIPVPEPVSFQKFAMERRWLEHKYDENVVYEVRNEPAPGGVRPILEVEPVPVEIITKNDDENQQLTIEESAHSTTPTEITPLQSSADPSVQSSDAD
jgi:hypothetical protein